MIKRMLIYAVLIFVSYQGLSYYVAYTTVAKLSSCTDIEKYRLLDKSSVATREKLLFSAKAWRCVKLKQNFIEAFFYKVPESWTNPSRHYVDPSFTEEELKEEVAVVDAIVKNDLKRFVKIFSKDVLDEITLQITNIKLTESDKTKSELQNKSVALKKLIGNLRDFEPDSTEVMILKTQLAYSLDQLKITYEDGLQIYADASKSIVEADALLSKPKSELQLHRADLLKLKSEMNNFDLKFRALQAREELIAKDLISVADKIDGLIRANG